MLADSAYDRGLLSTAKKVRLLAEQHAAESDTERRLPGELIDAVVEAGFARHLVPARWGGGEGTFTELTGAVTEVGEGCAATAWCASLAAYSARSAAYLPLEGQHDLWETGPDEFIVSGLVPSGTARAVDGGWRIGGRWSYVSAAEFAGWALLCGPAPADKELEPRFFAVPRGAFEIVESWDNVGMRATASHTVVVDDVFVPAHRSFARADLMAGNSGASVASCHTVPFPAVGGLAFVGPALGAGRGALDACVSALTGKRRLGSAELMLTRAAGVLDMAELLVQRLAGVLDRAPVPRPLVARNARDAAMAGELAADAVSLLVRTAGTSGLSESLALQRFWRDVTCATTHVALRFETSAADYAHVLLGPGRNA